MTIQIILSPLTNTFNMGPLKNSTKEKEKEKEKEDEMNMKRYDYTVFWKQSLNQIKGGSLAVKP